MARNTGSSQYVITDQTPEDGVYKIQFVLPDETKFIIQIPGLLRYAGTNRLHTIMQIQPLQEKPLVHSVTFLGCILAVFHRHGFLSTTLTAVSMSRHEGAVHFDMRLRSTLVEQDSHIRDRFKLKLAWIANFCNGLNKEIERKFSK